MNVTNMQISVRFYFCLFFVFLQIRLRMFPNVSSFLKSVVLMLFCKLNAFSAIPELVSIIKTVNIMKYIVLGSNVKVAI